MQLQAGGLLAYWFGVPNSRGSNLATCIWMSRAHAVRAIAGPKHVEAMRLAEASLDWELFSSRREDADAYAAISVHVRKL